MPAEDDRERIEQLLFAAAETQRHYWDALSELESALNYEIDGEMIGNHDVDSLIAMAQNEDSDDDETTN